MGSVNKVILVGNLGRDPELKYGNSGMAIANLVIATSSGGRRDREPTTEWHRVVVFDKQAENCQRYLSKGRQVYVEGRLQTRSWIDQQSGQKRYTTEIIAHQVVFLSSGQGGGRYPGARNEGGYGDQADAGGTWGRSPQDPSLQQSPEPSDDLPPPAFNDDDDIPF